MPAPNSTRLPSTPARGRETPTPAALDPDEAELHLFVDDTVVALNDYWAAEFQAIGRTYTPPTFVKAAYNQRIQSACGKSRGSDHSYCPDENTVYVDFDSDAEDSFLARWYQDRPLVVVATLGHEWGHHVQNQLDLFAGDSGSVEDSRTFELQADCLIGLFIASYQTASDWVERSDIQSVIRDTRESGDDPDLPRSEMDHGTSRERVAAFRQGYAGQNLSDCGVRLLR